MISYRRWLQLMQGLKSFKESQELRLSHACTAIPDLETWVHHLVHARTDANATSVSQSHTLVVCSLKDSAT
jgi:hypothetical protein